MVTASEMRRRRASAKKKFADGGAVDEWIAPDDKWIVPQEAKPSTAMQDLSKMSNALEPRKVSQGRAALEGVLSGASADWRDEIYGASHASGLPEWLGGLRAPVGAARLGYEYLTGQPGSATEAYEEGKNRIRGVQKAAQDEYPLTYGAGNIGGALATIPLAGGIQAATLPTRIAQGAKIGAVYGGLSGAGGGEGLEGRLGQGATGAAIGAGLGAAAPVAIEGAGRLTGAIGGLASKTTAPLRGLRDPESEAARRVAAALERDRAVKGGLSLTPEEASLAQQAGQDIRIGDLGGETTRALARSAANTSPEAREILHNVIEPRFEGQSLRAADFVRGLVQTPANALRTKDALEDAARTYRKPFYDAAYAAGRNGIWNDDLDRIAKSPVMLPIIKEAAQSIETKMATGRAAYPITKDGTPTLEFWDQVKRTLDSKINVAKRQGEKEYASDLMAIRDKVIQSADEATIDPKTGVSAYATARGVASEIFKASNAVEAGEKFLSSTMKNPEARKALMRMGQEERDAFAEGYASSLVRKIEESGDRRNIVNAIFQNPASRERIEIALGPKAAKDMETFLRVENILDAMRRSMGNSTTARQLAEMGLAGSGYGLATNDFSPTSLVTGALLWKGAKMAGKGAINAADRKTAERVAELLMSNDPAVLKKGIQAINRNPRLQEAVRNSDSYLARVGVLEAPKPSVLPMLQGTIPARADKDEEQ